MAAPTFIFGGENMPKTPQELARMRAIAEALAGSRRPAQNVGEGLADIGNAIAYRMMTSKANKAEAAGRASAASAFSSIFPSSDFPSAPSPASPAGGSRAASASMPAEAATIREGLIKRGLPEHVADGFVLNFKDESNLNPGINEAAPIVPGSRGGFGLSQWTGPRRKALEAFAAQRGVDVSDADTQLDFLMTELQGPEASAYKAIMGTKDAGSAAAAIVNKFLRPAEEHRARRERQYLSAGAPSYAAPMADNVQLASADPQFAIDMVTQQQAAPDTMQAGQPVTSTRAGNRVLEALMNPQSMGGGPIQRPQQMAQADIPPMAGGPAPQMSQNTGPTVQQLMEAAQNPWLNEGQRAIVNMLLQQQMERQDPSYQMDLEKQRLELEALRNPGDPFTLSPGQIRFDKRGNRIAEGGPDTDAPTVQKLKLDDGSEVAVQWDAQSGSWIPLNAPQGGGVANPRQKLTESQSKLTLFQSLQTETQPVLLDLENQFNPANLPDAFARGVLGGNFFQTPEGQMYSAASTAWAEGALRIATGAAATPEEMERTKKAYFAQPGDGPQTIKFKAQMREMYNRSIERGLGRTDVEGSLPKPSEFAQQFLPEGVTEEDVEFTMQKHGLTRDQVLERLR